MPKLGLCRDVKLATLARGSRFAVVRVKGVTSMPDVAEFGELTYSPSQWIVHPAADVDEGVVQPPHVRLRPSAPALQPERLMPEGGDAIETPSALPDKLAMPPRSLPEGGDTPDASLLLTETEIAREIISLVPHWYQAECGPVEFSLPVGSHTARFYNHSALTPHLSLLLERICEKTRELSLSYFVQLPSLTDVLLESFAIEWLRIHSIHTDWTKIIRYLEALARRTYENVPVALNLVIRPGRGVGDITQPYFQKFLDRLASSALSYLAVDGELRLMEYGEVDWTQFKKPPPYKFYCDGLHPIHGIMEEEDLSAHLTPQGDILVMNKAGLLAARRKRRWKLYEVETFKDSLAYCLENAYVGMNLFEVVLDLGLRRQGALLVYDPEHRIRERILNPESIIFPGWKREGESDCRPCSGQSLVSRSVDGIAIGKSLGSLKKKRRLIEMACVDGAVVFDDHRLLAIGALIRSHLSVGNQLGARTTAARSAYLWGGAPDQSQL